MSHKCEVGAYHVAHKYMSADGFGHHCDGLHPPQQYAEDLKAAEERGVARGAEIATRSVLARIEPIYAAHRDSQPLGARCECVGCDMWRAAVNA